MELKARKILSSQKGLASMVMILLTALLVSIATGLVYVNSKNYAMNRTSGDAVAAEQAAIGGVKHLKSYLLDYNGWTGSNVQTWFNSHSTWQGTLTADDDNPDWSSTYNVTWQQTANDTAHWEYTITSTGTHNKVNRVVYAILYVEKNKVTDVSNDITALTSTNPTIFKLVGNETWNVNNSGGYVDYDTINNIGWLYMRFGDGDKYDLDALAQKIKEGGGAVPMDIAYRIQLEQNYNVGHETGFGIFYLMQDGNFEKDNTLTEQGAVLPGISGYVVQYDPGLTALINGELGTIKISDSQSVNASLGFLLTRKTNNTIITGPGGNEDRSDNAYAFESNQGYSYSTNTNVPWYNNIVDISTGNNVFNSTYNTLYNAATDVVQVPFEQVKSLVEYAYLQSGSKIGVSTFNVSDEHKIEIKVQPVLTDASVTPPKHDDVTAVYVDGVLVLRYIDRCNTDNTDDPLVYNKKYTHGASGIKIWHAKFKLTNIATTHAGRKPYISKWKNN
jgi:hypothetical protein